MINKIQTKLYFFSLSIFIVLIDQFTKYLIFYNFIIILFYSQYNLFLYNLGKYSLGKIGYHFLMLFPLLLLIKPIERLKRSK